MGNFNLGFTVFSFIMLDFIVLKFLMACFSQARKFVYALQEPLRKVFAFNTQDFASKQAQVIHSISKFKSSIDREK